MNTNTYNLDINSYTIDELFKLLKLPLNPTKEDMFLAKKHVLSFHPDKSHLPNEYFIFYKKAFDISLKYYEEMNRQTRVITEENTKYDLGEDNNTKSMRDNIQKISGGKNFNSTFNQIYNEKMRKTPENNNQWFNDTNSSFDEYNGIVKSHKNIGDAFAKIKEKNQALIVHKEFRDFSSRSGHQYHDEDEDLNEYISSDPFSKLKFDDLRKVHKDQTVFAVGESDFQKVPQYSSVDHYRRDRDMKSAVKLDKSKSESAFKNYERELAKKEEQMKEQYLQKLHKSNMKLQMNEEKNKEILGSFLQLENRS
jgi:hypothetical protein